MIVLHSIKPIDRQHLVYEKFADDDGLVVVELAKSEDYVFLRAVNFRKNLMATIEVSRLIYEVNNEDVIKEAKNLIRRIKHEQS